MKYYSTNGKAPVADLRKAVVKGLAEDRGLYMPEVINKLPQQFFTDMPKMKFQDIAFCIQPRGSSCLHAGCLPHLRP